MEAFQREVALRILPAYGSAIRWHSAHGLTPRRWRFSTMSSTKLDLFNCAANHSDKGGLRSRLRLHSKIETIVRSLRPRACAILEAATGWYRCQDRVWC